MYLIANASNNEIVIEDLGITLFPRQALDLHKINTKIKPDQSSNLKHAISKKAIKVLMIKEDVHKSVVEEHSANVDKNEILNELKTFLKDEITKNIQNIAQPQQPQNNNSEQIDRLIKLVENMSTRGLSVEKGSSQEIGEPEVDNSRIVDIHTKAIKKITKDAQSSISYSKEEIIDKDFNSNSSELDELL